MHEQYWMPKAAFPMAEMPVPCPECDSTTFDECPTKFVCSDCGWTTNGVLRLGLGRP